MAFVTGAASRGPDAMIIRYCEEENYPYFEYPADWDNLGKSAGMIRNAQMRKVITHLLAFWDGRSAGTEEMIRKSFEEGIQVATIIVTTYDQNGLRQHRKNSYGKQKSRRRKYPSRY